LDLQCKPEEAVKETLKEIEAALDDIKTGVAGDFRWRLRAR
jgi:DNA-directed RNA polymerase subunit L